jgi:hypothetical protein
MSNTKEELKKKIMLEYNYDQEQCEKTIQNYVKYIKRIKKEENEILRNFYDNNGDGNGLDEDGTPIYWREDEHLLLPSPLLFTYFLQKQI